MGARAEAKELGRGDFESKGGGESGGLTCCSATLHVPRSPSCRICCWSIDGRVQKGEREGAEREVWWCWEREEGRVGSAGLQVEEVVYKLSLVGDVVVLWAKSVSWGWGERWEEKAASQQAQVG